MWVDRTLVKYKGLKLSVVTYLIFIFIFCVHPAGGLPHLLENSRIFTIATVNPCGLSTWDQERYRSAISPMKIRIEIRYRPNRGVESFYDLE